MDHKEEIAKYQKILADINAKLQSIDEQRTGLLRHGMRVEGILAYLTSKEQESAAEAKAPAETAPEA